MMQVCTVASGNTAFTESGRPLSPSQTTKKTSRTPRDFRSVSTAYQNFADSPSPSPAHMPFDVLVPAQVHPDRRVHGPVADLPVADQHRRSRR
jgi:hypothetical protein